MSSVWRLLGCILSTLILAVRGFGVGVPVSLVAVTSEIFS